MHHVFLDASRTAAVCAAMARREVRLGRTLATALKSGTHRADVIGSFARRIERLVSSTSASCGRSGASSKKWLGAPRLTTHRRAYASDADVDLRTASFVIWGANTGVGKTLVSGGLAQAARRAGTPTLFLKPVQTGFPEDSDAEFVARVAKGVETMGEHAAVAASTSPSGPFEGETPMWAHTMYAWRKAAGPHVSAALEGRPVMDEEIVRMTGKYLQEFANKTCRSDSRPLALIETAGGVASPGPSGNLQCELLRALRLPAILVGDGSLGGISTTTAAYESLYARGYDIVAIAMADDGLANHRAMVNILPCQTPITVLPALPLQGEADAWLEKSKPAFDNLVKQLINSHEGRLETLRKLPDEALKTFWWPFTQHAMVERDAVTVIDGRYGEDFAIYAKSAGISHDGSVLLRFDGAASWWTQGFSPELQQELVSTATHAAGRYGHVMFPENVHEPAVNATKALLEGPGRGWASRVFYSDNGSTATEVGLKMAFRKYYVNAGLLAKDGDQRAEDLKILGRKDLPPLRILALDGSYHGDTLGAMDMQSPSIFTGPMQTPWYQPRGLFLHPPSLAIRNGHWTVALPSTGITPDTDPLFSENAHDVSVHTSWTNKADAFDMSARQDTPLAREYTRAIESVFEQAERDAKSASISHIGALIMEPVLHGAGGMVLVDPLFQNILMKACRARGIPIVLDEVFAGIWRLGTEGAWEIIGEKPDISCYAKLLTGGLMPMSATLATEDVYSAFYGPGKEQGLLHGHSYTAYPMGCAVAAKALSLYKDAGKNPNLIGSSGKESASSPALSLGELWDEDKLKEMSKLSNVRRVIGQGCVLAVELEVEGDGGYSSNAAREVVMRLRNHSIQARPLGNVVYLMCAPTTSKSRCDRLLVSLTKELRPIPSL